jgi:hypothetical protein
MTDRRFYRPDSDRQTDKASENSCFWRLFCSSEAANAAAQQAARDQNTILNVLNGWLVQCLKIARVALRERPASRLLTSTRLRGITHINYTEGAGLHTSIRPPSDRRFVLSCL